MDQPKIALKEWAVAIKALKEGRQTLIMRKGGIAEETKQFEVASRDFYLYPTYEHQREELIKPEYRGELAHTLTEWRPENEVVLLTAYAEVAEEFQVMDRERLLALSDFHIWTEDFAEQRLKWKKTHPLHVLLLRIYELERPVPVRILPDYLGCKSWIRLAESFDKPPMHPVLDDNTFSAIRQKLHAALGQRV